MCDKYIMNNNNWFKYKKKSELKLLNCFLEVNFCFFKIEKSRFFKCDYLIFN